MVKCNYIHLNRRRLIKRVCMDFEDNEIYQKQKALKLIHNIEMNLLQIQENYKKIYWNQAKLQWIDMFRVRIFKDCFNDVMLIKHT